jgi:hypothetical protein
VSTKAITDPDLRQCSPAAMARQMGWQKPPGQIGWSWKTLLNLAHRKFDANSPRRRETAA